MHQVNLTRHLVSPNPWLPFFFFFLRVKQPSNKNSVNGIPFPHHTEDVRRKSNSQRVETIGDFRHQGTGLFIGVSWSGGGRGFFNYYLFILNAHTYLKTCTLSSSVLPQARTLHLPHQTRSMAGTWHHPNLSTAEKTPVPHHNISSPLVATVLTAQGNTDSLPRWPSRLTGLRNMAKIS